MSNLWPMILQSEQMLSLMLRPERFLNSTIDFDGHNFWLFPFGAGRRGCPGISFAIAIIELVLSNLLYKFDWELPNGMKGQDLVLPFLGKSLFLLLQLRILAKLILNSLIML